ncbi:hypothetical protein K7I13_03500 [Brucepastera parasyntrophica]|uniref:hypothetical protein n=1 Tax=Brucepastera parasyntrophica TaxID=2880008 RepID=UPI002108A5A3|nr:hypothetical protein [Brucepastera parasyntrophica]ULQ60386.1 hypothetical protein K7I13_03500 [Brucepastera parasyntrophica]
MGQVRSALEIALEKTADIQGDKTGAQSRELKVEGKKAATAYLEDRDPKKLASVLSGKKEADQQFIKEGALSIFLAAVRLPSAEDDLKKLTDIGAGLDVLLPDSGIPSFLSRLTRLCSNTWMKVNSSDPCWNSSSCRA